jgi:hypothetical protein
VTRATSNVSSRRALPVLLVALLVCVAAIFAVRPAAAGAAAAHSTCASTKGRSGARTCSSHKRSTRAHHKSKRSKTGHRQSKKVAKGGHSGLVNTGSAAPAPEPARCEDGSAPTREASGSYGCNDGSEPSCSDGAEPVVSSHRSQLLCPGKAEGTIEWSEAACNDGSVPHGTPGGGYACEDGSAPECEDGSQPTLVEGGTTLSCPESGPGAPPPSSSGPEESEDEAVEDALSVQSVRVETAS